MHYTVYKITNNANNKIYIGAHKTEDLDDEYLGSGTMITHARNKYGDEKFTKEYLKFFNNEDEMYEYESELVTPEFIKESSNYNIKPGGRGGWYNANSPDHIAQRIERITRDDIGKATRERHVFLLKTDTDYASKFKDIFKRGSAVGRARTKELYPHGTFKGKSHSTETKMKIGAASSIHQSGSKNSQFGSMWITDRVSNKKISKHETIPEGWTKGRIYYSK